MVNTCTLSIFKLTSSRSALKDMGPDFLTGYIALADGEKDPRNLMVAFAIARVIGIEFDIKRHVEVFPPLLVVLARNELRHRASSTSCSATSQSRLGHPRAILMESLLTICGKRFGETTTLDRYVRF
jgi:hypothetical protein